MIVFVVSQVIWCVNWRQEESKPVYTLKNIIKNIIRIMAIVNIVLYMYTALQTKCNTWHIVHYMGHMN